MTARVSPPSAYRAPVNGLAAAAVRLDTVPLVEVRLRLPVPVPDPHSAAATEVAAEMLFGPEAPVTRSLARLGCYVVAVADQDALCVAATGPAAALPELLSGIGAAVARPPTGAAVVASAIRSLAEQSRAADDDPETVATRAVLAAAYGSGSPYAHELPASDLAASVRPEEVRELCGRITTAGGSVVVVGDLDPSHAVESVVRHLDGLGGPPVPPAPLPPVPASGVNLAVHRPGARQTTLRRVLVLPPRARDSAAWRVCDLLFGGQPSSRLAHRLREENGYAYIARSRLVRRPRRADLRVVADVGAAVTGAALAALDDVTRRMADGVGEDEHTAAGAFAATSLLMSHGGQSDLAGVLTQELGLGRGADDVEGDVTALTAVTRDEVECTARELALGAWHTVLVGDLDGIGRHTLPAVGGADWIVAGRP
ncbi:zinc protease [Streptomyces sp. V4I23]|uniref:M16 family metallopeptidase n=1 Tax=Streptomyces sp. V4I23 TaxID=3042282 RepID=UPI00278A427A|nr:insulinase family protein [Streptomyces sp. V4I23]MDQ1007699.1 zinc protease [Streptomyces sp. V4I23]